MIMSILITIMTMIMDQDPFARHHIPPPVMIVIMMDPVPFTHCHAPLPRTIMIIISNNLAKSHVQGALPVLFRVRLQLQPRPLLDRLVVHRLQRVARVEPSEDDLVNLVPDRLCTRTETAKGRQLVHLARILHKLLVRQPRAVLDRVRGDSVDEIRDRIVGSIQHLHNVD